MEVYMYLCISMYIYIYAYILCTHIICTIDCQSHYHMLFVSRACNAQIMANMCLFAWSKLELEDVRLTLFLATTTLSHRKRAPATALRGRCRAQDYDKSGTRISELGGGAEFEFQDYIFTVGGIYVRLVSFQYLLLNATHQLKSLFRRNHPLDHTFLRDKEDGPQSVAIRFCVLDLAELSLPLRNHMYVDCQ